MTENPYTPPSTKPPRTFQDLPRDERKALVLAGDTTAGPLAVFVYKHPALAALIIGLLAAGGLLVSCWSCIKL
jgi:hypothetical protein